MSKPVYSFDAKGRLAVTVDGPKPKRGAAKPITRTLSTLPADPNRAETRTALREGSKSVREERDGKGDLLWKSSPSKRPMASRRDDRRRQGKAARRARRIER